MSEDKELWMTRAAACELLALSLRYPTDELARILASGEWADAAREIAAALGAELSEDAVAELPAGDEGEGWAVPDAELPGGSASAAYDQFVADHLSTWAPDFAERLFTEARIPFYRSVAGLLSTFLAAKS